MSLTPQNLQPTDKLIDLLDKDKSLKEILELIDSENIDIDVVLLQTKTSLLSTAANKGRLDLVKELINRGAKFDHQNIKSALRGKNLDIAIYLLKINQADYAKNLDLLIKSIFTLTKEDQENIARIKAISDPQVKEREVLNALIKDGIYIDFSQERIIKKFQRFLEIQRAKNPESYPNLESFIKSFSNGFCNGEVLLWLYKSEQGTEEALWHELTTFLLWSEEEADLEKTNEKGEKWGSVFNQILANILGMYNPRGYYHLPLHQSEFGKIVALHTKSEAIVLDSLFTLLMTEEELRVFLPELVQNELMIGMGNLKHRIGYLKGKFLDPNSPLGVQKIDTPDELIDAIVKAFPTPKRKISPIILHRFAKAGSKPIYAAKEDEVKAKWDFLDRLYQFRKQKGEKHDQIIDYRSHEGATQLYLASIAGDIETVKWCLDKGANLELEVTIEDLSQTPLCGAAGHGMVEVVRLLLEKGANLFPKNSRKPFIRAIERNNIEVVKLIIEHLRSQDKLEQPPVPSVKILFAIEDGFTPLHYCISDGNMDIFDVLMENGADINLGKSSPIIQGVSQGDPDIVRRILKYKDKIDFHDLIKALLIAIRDNKNVMIEDLAKAIFRVTPIPSYKYFQLITKELIKKGFPPVPKMIPPDQAGFYLRAAMGRFSIEAYEFDAYQEMEFILKNSTFDVNAQMKDLDGKNPTKFPLKFAIENAIGEYEEEVVDKGGDPEKIIQKMKKIMTLLIENGLNPTSKYAGQSIEDFAREQDAPEELIKCITETIAESTKREAVVKSRPLLSRKHLPSSAPLPTASKPLQADSDRKVELADEKQAAQIWETLSQRVNDLHKQIHSGAGRYSHDGQSIDFTSHSVFVVDNIKETMQRLETSLPADASKTQLLSQLAKELRSLNDPKRLEGVNPMVISLLELCSPSLMPSPSGKPGTRS